MALLENAISAVTITLDTQIGELVLKEGEITFVRGLGQFRGGDGITPGGVSAFGSADPGGGTGGPSFGTIAVTGVDPSLWLQADQASDVLTLVSLRGMVISPIPGADAIYIGFPDGGAFGNNLVWNGSSWGPSPPPVAIYEPQEFELSTDILAEGARKLFDGVIPLETFLPATNPATVVTHHGVAYPSMGDAATAALQSVPKRLPMNVFSGLSLMVRCKCSATAGNVRVTGKIAAVADVTAAPSFGTPALVTAAVPASGLLDVVIPLTSLGGVVAGGQFMTEFGRVGADAADTAVGAIIVVDAFLVMA